MLTELVDAPISLSLIVFFFWVFSFYPYLNENMTRPSSFITNMDYNCFFRDEMNANVFNKINLLSCGRTFENGQCKACGLLPLSKQFSTKLEHEKILPYTCTGLACKLANHISTKTPKTFFHVTYFNLALIYIGCIFFLPISSETSPVRNKAKNFSPKPFDNVSIKMWTAL